MVNGAYAPYVCISPLKRRGLDAKFILNIPVTSDNTDYLLIIVFTHSEIRFQREGFLLTFITLKT